ncbi:hypothetical protein [Aquimarina longa]|uniref:hypothetical protein n=1 Tax=Aquimarina longa TaxID=1080221 RepID=UPI0007818502|nr:hypothetical protein [Aquimarina longa]
MKKLSNISHPLLNRTGTSQRTRIIDALQSESAPVDGKTLADRLYIISTYAQQIKYYEYIENESETAYQDIDNWISFFQNSLPFQLAILSKTSISDLENEFTILYTELKQNPSKQSLESLLVFVFNKCITPASVLFTKVEKEKNNFATPLLAILNSSYTEPFKEFIKLYNASATFLCVTKKNFSTFMAAPWQLKVEEIYAIDINIQQVKKGKKEAFTRAGTSIHTIFYKLLSGFQDIINTAPDYIEESLRPLETSLQKRHQPHLALVFTFLELLNHLKDDSNNLGKKHLDFFYQKVLRFIPKEAVPDKAHIIFEISKHLEEYFLPKNVVVKNGKDANKQDIQFGLDHEIIIDKAQVVDLRTLYINTFKNTNYTIGQNTEETYTEGVYIAPIANSIDGKGGEFKKYQSGNWPTLGAKYSKSNSTVIDTSNEDPCRDIQKIGDEYPKARLGFVLSSPILLLQEGKRSIRISLICETVNDIVQQLEKISSTHTMYTIVPNMLEGFKNLFLGKEKAFLDVAEKHFKSLLGKKVHQKIYENDVNEFLALKKDENSYFFSVKQKNDIIAFLGATSTIKQLTQSVFKLAFSGEKEWLIPNQDDSIVFVSFTNGELTIAIQVDVTPDFLPITFYDKEKLKEKIDVKEHHPVVKIELNDEIKINFESTINPDRCSLRKQKTEKNIQFSLYHILSQLKLKNANIDVEVCGVKNLIVQNDEGRLDINSQIFPFGLRPEVTGYEPMNQLDWEGVQDENSMLGPSFYIGSKEVLFKNWQAVRVNIEWKDKPESFNDHYKAYLKEPNDVSDTQTDLKKLGLNEEGFKLKIDSLEDGVWEELVNRTELFSTTAYGFETLNCNNTIYGWEVKNKTTDTFVDFNERLDFFKNSQNGFLKFTLADQDFLHREYPFVLARQMLAYALSSQGEKLTDAIYVSSNKTVIRAVDDLSLTGEDITTSLEKAITSSDNLITSITSLETYINTNEVSINTIIQGLNDVFSDISTYIDVDLENFAIDLDLFNTTNLAGLTGFLTTLGSIRDTLLDRNNPQLISKVTAIETTLQTFFSQINAKLLGSGNTSGIQKLAEDIVDEIDSASGTLQDLINLIKVPAKDVKTGINDIVTLIDNADDVADSNSLVSKINDVIVFINGIKGYIEDDFDSFRTKLQTYINDSIIQVMGTLVSRFTAIKGQFITFKGELNQKGVDLDKEFNSFITELLSKVGENGSVSVLVTEVKDSLNNIDEVFKKSNILKFFSQDASQALIPNEPWTPTFKNLYLDYTAKATKEEIDIIHLYPFENTTRLENITEKPTLFPSIKEEGTLFMGIKDITPGGNLSILFQLAEATANSEMNKAKIEWHYLSNNHWRKLEEGFHIISDETDGLTVSGIVTIAVPDTINKKGNTLMSEDLYWIKISALSNTKAIAETIGIHTQAAKISARLSKLNDTNRLNTALASGSINKLSEGDFNIKKIEQLYPSSGGKQPEATGHFYTRVSEHLKHKGRALMLNDYEKIVLEGFPEIYKTKCISHTMGLSAVEYQKDLEIAPGYIVLAVVPDLTKLVSGNQLEPKVPVSLLAKIGAHLKKKTSPFARIKVMNPRYEYVDVTIEVRLYRGKPQSFYKQKLQEDITNFLAPWYLGDTEKIAFGMPVLFSDIVGFVERLEYIDFIANLQLRGENNQNGSEIKPLTARSILTAGKVCVSIDKEECTSTDQGSNLPYKTEIINQSSELS